MNPETAEAAAGEPLAAPAARVDSRAAAAELPAPPARAAHASLPMRLRARLRELRADEARMTALRDCRRAFLGSRLLIWTVGVGTVALFGFGPHRNAFDPPGTTRGFGWLGDLLAAPAARWDSAWYLVIAHFGYRPDLGSFTASRTAFFPLYPLALRGLSQLGSPPVLAGVLISLVAFAAALYGIHRLTTLEFGHARQAAGAGGAARAARAAGAAGAAAGGAGAGRAAETARLAVLLTAFAPVAFFFSAVYSESLFLALSVGVFWSARKGRWWLAGLLGALAAATRSTGLVLLLPVALLYLYGPREDRAPDRSAARLRRARRGERAGTRLAGRLSPRYRLRADVLWLALIPLGGGAFSLWLALGGGDGLSPFHTQVVWGRHFAGPYLGIWDGLQAGFDGVRQLLSFQRQHVYFPQTGGSPFVTASHNLILLGFLVAAIPALVAAVRRLPAAYAAYAIAALALPLSYPVTPQPLMSLPRFLLVLFPLTIGVASWLSEHPRAVRPLLVLSTLLMVFFLCQFATWHWVA